MTHTSVVQHCLREISMTSIPLWMLFWCSVFFLYPIKLQSDHLVHFTIYIRYVLSSRLQREEVLLSDFSGCRLAGLQKIEQCGTIWYKFKYRLSLEACSFGRNVSEDELETSKKKSAKAFFPESSNTFARCVQVSSIVNSVYSDRVKRKTVYG